MKYLRIVIEECISDEDFKEQMNQDLDIESFMSDALTRALDNLTIDDIEIHDKPYREN